jgi:hypothetical protein
MNDATEISPTRRGVFTNPLDDLDNDDLLLSGKAQQVVSPQAFQVLD